MSVFQTEDTNNTSNLLFYSWELFAKVRNSHHGWSFNANKEQHRPNLDSQRLLMSVTTLQRNVISATRTIEWHSVMRVEELLPGLCFCVILYDRTGGGRWIGKLKTLLKLMLVSHPPTIHYSCNSECCVILLYIDQWDKQTIFRSIIFTKELNWIMILYWKHGEWLQWHFRQNYTCLVYNDFHEIYTTDMQLKSETGRPYWKLLWPIITRPTFADLWS